MGQFRHFLSEALLKEIHLHGRLFTWGNERAHPTLERIDRAFVSTGWEDLYPNHGLQSLASSCSDHAPLLLHTDESFRLKKRFHFQAFWPKFSGFSDTVKLAWHCPLRNTSPFRWLDWLLQNTVHVLSSRSARSIGSIWMQLELAREVLHQLEIARDHRLLAPHEDKLQGSMKLKTLGLSSLQRMIAR
jgi:hypothetical protein